MRDKIIACDLGTGGNKTSLYDSSGRSVASVFVPYETIYPETGWHEQRPEDWWSAVVESTKKLRQKSGFNPGEIKGIVLSGHSLGCVPLDDTGGLLRKTTPIWSDTRSSKQTKEYFSKIDPVQ
jgi:xylulokinase